MINYNRMCVPICYTCINDAAYPVLLWSFSLFLHIAYTHRLFCVRLCVSMQILVSLHNAKAVINLLLFCIQMCLNFRTFLPCSNAQGTSGDEIFSQKCTKLGGGDEAQRRKVYQIFYYQHNCIMCRCVQENLKFQIFLITIIVMMIRHAHCSL